uniref:Protein LTV1 homolog n=1 Tax=Mesocestoides corti TaxID=53468 RepID=A0A5K3FHJ7_MESCO
MTDVPEWFNYGVFFDDGYDYLKHMKSMKEFVEDPNFVLVGEENTPLPENYVPPVVEPVVTDDLDPDFEMPSDDELIAEVGELEDNFVELAGGKPVHMDDDDQPPFIVPPPPSPPPQMPSISNLPLHKVRMMERFLWGSESTDAPEAPEGMEQSAPSTVDSSMRKGRPLTEEEELLEKQFDRLMQRTKARSGFDGRSMVSGASVMSESLQSAVAADEVMIAKHRPIGSEWERLDSAAKVATLQCVQEMPEPDDTTDPLKQWIGPEKPNIGDITSKQASTPSCNLRQPEVLPVPRKRAVAQQSPAVDVDVSDASSSDGDHSKPLEYRRTRGETAEEKRARKAAIKLQKKERQQARKLNKANFRRDLLRARATGQVRVARLE